MAAGMPQSALSKHFGFLGAWSQPDSQKSSLLSKWQGVQGVKQQGYQDTPTIMKFFMMKWHFWRLFPSDWQGLHVCFVFWQSETVIQTKGRYYLSSRIVLLDKL